MKLTTVAATLIALLLPITTGCSQPNLDQDPDLIARVGKQRLIKSDLERVLTPGLNSDDSTRLARAYVKSWIDARLMSEIAARNIPDMSLIDQMVEDYRNELITWEYRRLMFSQHGDLDFPEDTLRAYYETHRKNFVTEHPLVKGVYVKIADNSPSLARVKKLYTSTRDADIDRLEKQDLQGLIHYDYFRDRWVDWDQIETRIPYDFGASPEEFLSTHKHIEIKSNGFVHLLDISEYLKSGSIMPYEKAVELIQRDLFNLKRKEYDAQLKLDLMSEGLNNGSIIINTQL